MEIRDDKGLVAKAGRMKYAILTTFVLLFLELYLFPAQAGVILTKLQLVVLAAVIGYMIDREVFYYGRPHLYATPCGEESALQAEARVRCFYMCMIRRAIVMGSVILALCLAL